MTNHIVEIVVVEKRSQLLHDFRKLNKYEYLDMRTGEVKKFTENQFPNRNRSFTTLRRYINMNFTGKENEIFITLTYAEPEYQRSKISHDFKNFWKKFKYHHKSCEYIAVYEPHQSGAWHIHALVKDIMSKVLFVDASEIQKFWGLGFIKILRLKDNDNIGAYFTALSRRDNSKKELYKGERITWYPKYAKCFTHSKNIKKPIYKTMTFENAMKLVEHSTESYSNPIEIYDHDEIVNTIYYLQFNSKRRKDDPDE